MTTKEKTMANLIAEAAKGYNAVEQFLKLSSSAVKPLTLEYIYSQVTHAKNQQQVNDALRKFYKNGWVSKIKEGRVAKYWWKSNSGLLSGGQQAHAIPQDYNKLTKEPLCAPEINLNMKHTVVPTKPEILVTKNSVVINSINVKITVEF